MYALVAILTDRGALAETYTYEVPRALEPARAGQCVLVPFQTQTRLGYITEISEETDIPRIKQILARYPLADLPLERVEMAEWMAKYWCTSMGICLRLMIPPAIRGRVIRWVCPVETMEQVPAGKPGLIYQTLQESGKQLLSGIYTRFGKATAQRAISELRKKGLVKDEIQLVQPGYPKNEKLYKLAKGVDIQGWIKANGKRKRKQAAVLRYLHLAEEPARAGEIAAELGDPAPALKALMRDGLIREIEQEVSRRARETTAEALNHCLTTEQQCSLDLILGKMKSGEFSEILLFGVTGSGKTEIYLRAISEALLAGKSALVLMPEIALTVHAVALFRSRFADNLAVLHSRLSTGERADEWRRVASGEAKVVLGPRSAVFAPLADPGIIIIDEEHEPAFKQESDPRYHARDLCRWLAHKHKAPLVLGSATPSIETYHEAKQGNIILSELPSRIDDRPLPKVEIVDMRHYAKGGELTILSDRLKEHIKSNLANDGQAILFLNRRAYGTFVLCRECGFVPNCPNCAVSAKFHQADKTIRCHHCNWKNLAPMVCPVCGGFKIASFGIGTQRVEEELIATVPDARVLRMDRDTTAGKNALVDIIEQFKNRKADILLGTQMVAKGLDFPEVLLVGIVSADTGLNVPDFRAAERGFQLLTQVAGRAGRGQRPGSVVLQTFMPDHYAIQAAAQHDYERFYKEEISARKQAGWPPYCSTGRILFQCSDLEHCSKLANETAIMLGKIPSDVELMGPSPAPIEKIKSRHRWHLLLRSSERRNILELLTKANFESWPPEIIIDIEPASLL